MCQTGSHIAFLPDYHEAAENPSCTVQVKAILTKELPPYGLWQSRRVLCR